MCYQEQDTKDLLFLPVKEDYELSFIGHYVLLAFNITCLLSTFLVIKFLPFYIMLCNHNLSYPITMRC